MKGLSWRSVKVEPLPPRPLLDALTGGYRPAPVRQLGADVYCDTEVIFSALERWRPAPSLYPQGEGVAKALSLWWDRASWKPAIGVLTHYIGDQLPEEFLKDRKDTYLGYDMSKAAMAPDLPIYIQQLSALTEWLASMLEENGPFLTGDAISAADLTCCHSLWLLRANAGEDEIDRLLNLGALKAWMDRVAASGHGEPTDMTPEEAVAAARDAEPEAPRIRADGDPSGLKPGSKVTVTPDDNARVAVQGTLVAANAQEIILSTKSAETGTVRIHFPRAGFETLAA